ncbi:lipoyl(octanoyl) transferase LipB [Candidatus Deianiraea vastatrix]|uniref:Octanoyltransferase n=1 Tax=Candidatus Deianiraea vastatrix TaxID=2163644 RepID=A0A5B8XFI6_9RICK|nr:lipoyl(octanoyl) transferase LipB [Candidatus Deianiraea vastatrix]QED23061.1 Octanoyltransferase [Candidatus Deianiraea vastatrix]
MLIINDSEKIIKYQDSFDRMLELIDKIAKNESKEVVWFLQHEDIYTIGGSGSENDILDKSIPHIYTNRGGKVTYHGSGQLIMYTMIDVRQRFNMDAGYFVRFLENVIIKTLESFEIKAYLKDKMVGVWVRNGNLEEKIAAIGIRIKNGISYHGISLNINCNLSKFDKIIPCGIQNFGVCSMQSLKKEASIVEVCEKMQEIFLDELRKIAV